MLGVKEEFIKTKKANDVMRSSHTGLVLGSFVLNKCYVIVGDDYNFTKSINLQQSLPTTLQLFEHKNQLPRTTTILYSLCVTIHLCRHGNWLQRL